MSPARLQKLPDEYNPDLTEVEKRELDPKARAARKMMYQSASRPPAYFIYNSQGDFARQRRRTTSPAALAAQRLEDQLRKMEELKHSNETERSNLDFFFGAALQPNKKGDYNHGHPDTEKKTLKKLAQERTKFRKWMDKLDLKNTADYYRDNVKTIQVTGAKKSKLQKKQKNSWLNEKEEPDEGPRLSQLELEKRNHKKFLKLMTFLNDYSQTICYEGSGLINVNPKKRGGAADDFIDQER